MVRAQGLLVSAAEQLSRSLIRLNAAALQMDRA
jgi:hypothetical protein